MLFVDGENLLHRGCQAAKEAGFELAEGRCYEPDAFLWFWRTDARELVFATPTVHLDPYAWRAHYYTSAQGDDDYLEGVKAKLRGIGFDPYVFKRKKKSDEYRRPKGVDITLTRDLLSHAFRDNFEVSVLVTGDGDYLPVVDEVKRLGKAVVVASFSNGLNPALRVAADHFYSLDSLVGNLPGGPQVPASQRQK